MKRVPLKKTSQNSNSSVESLSQGINNEKIKERMILLKIQIKSKPSYKERKQMINYRVQKAVDLTTKWADNGEISRVVEVNRNT